MGGKMGLPGGGVSTHLARRAGLSAGLHRENVSTPHHRTRSGPARHGMIRTAHLGDLEAVQLLADPGVALDLLRVELPLRQEPDLPAPAPPVSLT